MLIILSDTHLGASGSKYKIFKKLLDQISQNLVDDTLFQEKFKGLIILGDFCDLLCDSYKDIATTFKGIFEKLDFLIDNGISVITILGNHDLSVSGNFEKKYRTRKLKYIKKFKKVKNDFKFLDDLNISQYVNLRNIGDEWYLKLFDSKDLRDENLLRNINMGQVLDLDRELNIIIAHGHQFYLKETKVGSKLWDFCLKVPDLIKEIFNYLWNVARRDLENMSVTDFEKLIQENSNMIEGKFNIKLSPKMKNQLKVLFENNNKVKAFLIELDNHKADVKNYFDEQIYPITHLIYAHTHKAEIFSQDNILFVNTGAFHQKNPSFIEIYQDGKINVKEMDNDGNWAYHNSNQ
jgi:UDP-2,3-diacylglucosamine pyrophosphatase LpxH